MISLHLTVEANGSATPGIYGGSFKYKVREGRVDQEDHYGEQLWVMSFYSR